jgi:GR25 family glycosyltransferase involved in LPS biosynthesis
MNIKVFVVHYKKLQDRKVHILEQLNKCNITDYEFIEIDRDELKGHNISMFMEGYSASQIAIALSHFHAYRQIRDKYDCGLIFEDDVILSNDFEQIFQEYLTELPDDYDMLFIGDGCGLHIQSDYIFPEQHIYRKCLYPTSWGGNGAGRCGDSYLVSKKCANILCRYIDNLRYKIKMPVDWWLNVAARDNDFIVYWSEPTIVTQGTQTGLFMSSH